MHILAKEILNLTKYPFGASKFIITSYYLILNYHIYQCAMESTFEKLEFGEKCLSF